MNINDDTLENIKKIKNAIENGSYYDFVQYRKTPGVCLMVNTCKVVIHNVNPHQ